MDDNISEAQLDEMIKDLETGQTVPFNKAEIRYIVTKLVIPVPTAVVQTGNSTCQQSFEYSTPLFKILGCCKTRARAEQLRDNELPKIEIERRCSNVLIDVNISEIEWE